MRTAVVIIGVSAVALVGTASVALVREPVRRDAGLMRTATADAAVETLALAPGEPCTGDRKSTRLNSSH